MTRSDAASTGLRSTSWISGKSTSNWLKRTSSVSRASRFTGFWPRTPWSASVNLGPFHQPPRQGAIERRQAKGTILEDLDENAATTEQDDRAELAIHRAADNQFVTAFADHGLHGDAFKSIPLAEAVDIAFDSGEGGADGLVVGEVELDAADIALVCEGRGQQLENNGITDLSGHSNGLIRRAAGGRRHDRKTVGSQHVLGFYFGEQGTAGGADLL